MKKIKLLTLLTLITLLTPHLFYSQWFQQTLPVSGWIRDLAFLNKDTGFIAMNNNDFLLRTTNAGINWTVIGNFRIQEMCVADNITLFGISVDGSRMYRTFNGGASFDSVGAPGGGYCTFCFVNKDTGWSSGLTGIFITTNGGNSFNLISTDANCGSFMFFVRQKYNNQYYGFHINNGLHKTTNSGVNWTTVSGISIYVYRCFFVNKDTGWVTDNNQILNTTNNGTNWIAQYTGFILYSIYFANKNRGWCGNQSTSLLATSNGGLYWGTQNSPIIIPGGLFFVDSLFGWAYNGYNSNNLIKTTNGGGNIDVVEIVNNNVPSKFQLYQNFPNPFNPSTTIEFDIRNRSYVKLLVYNILGKEIEILVNEELNTGTYRITWDASNFPSGIYYYSLISDNYRESRKMVYLK